MGEGRATLLWLRRDLRLSDHMALNAAIARGGPVIPVFILDEVADTLGAAPKWRLGLSLGDLSRQLESVGSRLILRKGDAIDTLRALIRETGAGAVYWSRAYDPDSVARDKAVKSALKADGLDAQSHEGHLMFEPWTVQTGAGGFYKVYSPFWRAVKDRDVPAPEPAPARIPAPDAWPASDRLEDWRLDAAMNRGAAVCRPYQRVGEDAAQGRLGWFTAHAIGAYDTDRDLPAEDGTSGLSEHLALGEISPRRCWHAGMRALHEGKPGAETWLKELVWREFAYHLAWHTPRIVDRNWREEWDAFQWNEDEDHPHVIAWKQGRTGIPFVDAAMREMYVTGRMHNRARMIVASYLTKHLLSHWRIGQRWFEACLTDWDPASNAMGWQWSAGSGPDATPYFRVFNPETQVQKFDQKGRYLDRWIAERRRNPTDTALSYFDAIPRKWGLSADDTYPDPIVGVKDGRARALAAYEARGF